MIPDVLRYWKWLSVLLALLAVVLLVGLYGNSRYQAGYNAAYADVSVRLSESAKKQAEQAYQANQEYQSTRAAAEQEEKIRYVEVQKIVERPVYRNVCLDDDGLQELNAAIAGSE